MTIDELREERHRLFRELEFPALIAKGRIYRALVERNKKRLERIAEIDAVIEAARKGTETR